MTIFLEIIRKILVVKINEIIKSSICADNSLLGMFRTEALSNKKQNLLRDLVKQIEALTIEPRRYGLALITDNLEMKEDIIYFSYVDHELIYTLIDMNGKKITDKITKAELVYSFASDDQLLTKIKFCENKILQILAKRNHIEHYDLKAFEALEKIINDGFASSAALATKFKKPNSETEKNLETSLNLLNRLWTKFESRNLLNVGTGGAFNISRLELTKYLMNNVVIEQSDENKSWLVKGIHNTAKSYEVELRMNKEDLVCQYFQECEQELATLDLTSEDIQKNETRLVSKNLERLAQQNHTLCQKYGMSGVPGLNITVFVKASLDLSHIRPSDGTLDRRIKKTIAKLPPADELLVTSEFTY